MDGPLSARVSSHDQALEHGHELTDMSLDPVALSAVLDAYGRHRLLSFDREESTGEDRAIGRRAATAVAAGDPLCRLEHRWLGPRHAVILGR